MSVFRTIRQQLGLSQQELAGLLGTTRSQLSYDELGTRMVGQQAAETLAALVPAWQAAIDQPAPPATPSPAALDAANTRAERCRFELYTLKEETAAMRSTYEQAAALRHTLTALQKLSNFSDKQQNWCAILLDKADRLLRQNATEKQWMLQLRVAALQAELTCYETAVAAATV